MKEKLSQKIAAPKVVKKLPEGIKGSKLVITKVKPDKRYIFLLLKYAINPFKIENKKKEMNIK